MRRLLGMAVLLFPGVANAQAACAAGSTCVPPEDMKVFVQLLQAQKCRQETTPTMKTDPVTIVIDREGRIYGSGDDPHPYRAHIEWCNYQIDVTSQIQLVAAQQIEPDYGFRFRLKAAIGYLPVEAWSEKDAGRGIDGGVLLEPFFFRWANVNGYVGVRSFGAGIGFDATKNFGPYLGYSMAWGTWRSNVMAGLSFSLW